MMKDQTIYRPSPTKALISEMNMNASDPTREIFSQAIRRNLHLSIEAWCWRAAFLGVLAYLLLAGAATESATVMRVRLTEDLLHQAAAPELIAREAAQDAAVVFEAADAPIDAAQAERWNALIGRIARDRPVAVALTGDVSAEALAIYAAAHQIFGQATAMIAPGALETTEEPAPRRAAMLSARGLGAGVTGSDIIADGPDIAFFGAVPDPEALRLASYGSWVREALLGRRPAGAELVAALERGRLLNGRQAQAGGLIDAIGLSLDAQDWALAAAADPERPALRVRLREFRPNR